MQFQHCVLFSFLLAAHECLVAAVVLHQDELSHWQAQYKKSPPKEAIVFIIGGTTYEEARAVAEFNERSDAPMRVVLGGSGLLNSQTFIDVLRSTISAKDKAAGSALEILR